MFCMPCSDHRTQPVHPAVCAGGHHGTPRNSVGAPLKPYSGNVLLKVMLGSCVLGSCMLGVSNIAIKKHGKRAFDGN